MTDSTAPPARTDAIDQLVKSSADFIATKRMVVVLPTYNERENLARMVRTLFQLEIPGLEVLVVDDSSPDGTGTLADELARARDGAMRVVHRAHKQGLGPAYIEGFRRALDDGADFVVEMDADFQHDPRVLYDFRRHIERYDIVAGSRYIPGGSVDPQWNSARKLLSRGGSAYARLVLGLVSHDPTGGFKCFRASALRKIDLHRIRSSGYAFQIEMSYAAQRAGLTVKEVPIHFVDRQRGASKMSSRIALEAAWRVWQIKRRY